MSNLWTGKGEFLVTKPEIFDFHPTPRKLWYPSCPASSVFYFPSWAPLTKMSVCCSTVYSFPAIDFSLTLLSALLQHEESYFSILMSFIPNTCPAHQNYPVSVSISVLRILKCSTLLLQIIPCHVIHVHIRAIWTQPNAIYIHQQKRQDWHLNKVLMFR